MNGGASIGCLFVMIVGLHIGSIDVAHNRITSAVRWLIIKSFEAYSYCEIFFGGGIRPTAVHHVRCT